MCVVNTRVCIHTYTHIYIYIYYRIIYRYYAHTHTYIYIHANEFAYVGTIILLNLLPNHCNGISCWMLVVSLCLVLSQEAAV